MSFARLVPFTDLISKIVDNRGRTCPTVDSGFPLIATNCVTNDTLYPRFEKLRFVSDETYAHWFRGHPEPGDIIFVCKGSPGRVCLTPDPVSFCIAQDMVAVRANRKLVDPLYLFAALRSEVVQDQISNLHVGTLIPHFKKGDFGKLLVPVPDLAVQHAIGKLYLSLSRKIEVNERIASASYESIRLFWHAAALDAKQTVRLAEVADVVKGLSYKGSGLGGKVPLINLGNFRTDGQFGGSALKYYDGEAKDRHWVQNGDLVMANTDLTQRRDILGQPALVEIPADKALFSHHVFAIRVYPNFQDDMLWLYGAFRQPAFRERAVTYATGTTVVALPKDAVLAYELAWPDRAVRQAWTAAARSLVDDVTARARENQQLSRMRDTLLPKLMSGEIRVRDAEREVENAL